MHYTFEIFQGSSLEYLFILVLWEPGSYIIFAICINLDINTVDLLKARVLTNYLTKLQIIDNPSIIQNLWIDLGNIDKSSDRLNSWNCNFFLLIF
jgi:hypothetical protein